MLNRNVCWITRPEPDGKNERQQACLKYSGRIGRTAAAKSLDEDAVRLAVIAHIRHAYTQYDKLLAKGYDRWEARAQVEEVVCSILAEWEGPK